MLSVANVSVDQKHALIISKVYVHVVLSNNIKTYVCDLIQKLCSFLNFRKSVVSNELVLMLHCTFEQKVK